MFPEFYRNVHQSYIIIIAPLNKMATKAKNEINLKTTSPESLAQIQNNFT